MEVTVQADMGPIIIKKSLIWSIPMATNAVDESKCEVLKTSFLQYYTHLK